MRKMTSEIAALGTGKAGQNTKSAISFTRLVVLERWVEHGLDELGVPRGGAHGGVCMPTHMHARTRVNQGEGEGEAEA